MLVFAFAWSPWIAVAGILGVFLARDLASPLYTIWLNDQITDSSVRATVISIAGQADAIGQAGGGPGLGAIGNAFGLRSALVAGGLVLAPAIALYGRAVAHHGREPELEALPTP
jgi:DHA3 family tetracycline resistance protein-like MFS transporter